MTGLTPPERRAVKMAGDLWNLMVQEVVGHGPTRDSDLSELCAKVHGIQHMIMGQAAARAHPDLYRLLGEELRPQPTVLMGPPR